MRHGLRVKKNNQGNGVAPAPTSRCKAVENGAIWSPLTTVANFTYFTYIQINTRHKQA